MRRKYHSKGRRSVLNRSFMVLNRKEYCNNLLNDRGYKSDPNTGSPSTVLKLLSHNSSVRH